MNYLKGILSDRKVWIIFFLNCGLIRVFRHHDGRERVPSFNGLIKQEPNPAHLRTVYKLNALARLARLDRASALEMLRGLQINLSIQD